jgi:hypothetical protein
MVMDSSHRLTKRGFWIYPHFHMTAWKPAVGGGILLSPDKTFENIRI